MSKEDVSDVSMKDIMRLTEQEKGELKAALVISKGIAQFWIHAPFDPKQRCYPPVDSYMTDLDKLVKRSSERIPAVAFIESSLAKDPAGRRLVQNAQYYAEIKDRPLQYCLRTYENDPTPSLNQDAWNLRDETNWNIFVQYLKELGLKRAILSGKHFHQEFAVDPYYQGCVGYTAGMLGKRGITCYQSAVTFPDIKGHATGYVPGRSSPLHQIQELIDQSRNSILKKQPYFSELPIPFGAADRI